MKKNEVLFFVNQFIVLLVLSQKKYYTGSGSEFVRNYGDHFKIFDVLFNNNRVNWDNVHKNYGGFYDHYITRDYSNYTIISNSEAAPSPFIDHRLYAPRKQFYSNQLGLEYNNKFRYGTAPHQRFISIFFSSDPWTSTDAWIVFIRRAKSTTEARHFTCNFINPTIGKSSMKYSGEVWIFWMFTYLNLCLYVCTYTTHAVMLHVYSRFTDVSFQIMLWLLLELQPWTMLG